MADQSGQTPSSSPSSHSSGAYLSPGAVVAGRYKILRTLGAGGMASVYLAEDLVLGETTVALKILKHSGPNGDSVAERFLREVRLTHKIHHENVVRTFDFGQEGATRFYTMEYLSGKTLTSLMTEEVLPIPTILKIALQICRGISAIHGVGVIHRDLKPDNIMVVDSLRVKITDFGVARGDVSMLTGGAEQILGTISYLAPETLVGEKVSPAVDYYALGAILYELLTGHLPIEDNIPARLIMRKVEERPADPRVHREDIPAWLADGVLQLLNPNPTSRMNSVRGFVQALANHAPADAANDLVTSTVNVNITTTGTGIFKPGQIAQAISSSFKPRMLSLREGVVAAVLTALISFTCLSSVGKIVERSQLDALFNIRGALKPSSEVAVVAIDEQSYLELGIPMATAWPRRLHSKLIDKLHKAGAKRVVFDILFVNQSEDPSGDGEFAEALGKMPTILGASIGYSRQATLNGTFMLEQVIRPAGIFEQRAAGIGLVGLPLENSRIYRFQTERSSLLPEGRPLAEAALGEEGSYTPPGSRDMINYYGPVPTVRRFSYHDVIADEQRIPKEAFKNAIVFVGLTLQSRTGPSQREAFTTPFDAGMFGTEIHATAASNILKQDWISRLSPQGDGVLVVALALISTVMVASLAGLPGILIPLGFLTVCGFAELSLFKSGTFAPIITPVLLGFLAGLVVRLILAPSGVFGNRRW
jgi:serine/threonine protein kinase